MALTLDSTLQTAQNGNDHKPIIELISKEILDSIPYDGQIFQSDNDCKTSIPLLLSDGRIATVYVGVGDYGDYHSMYLKLTDVNQTTFGTSVRLSNNTYGHHVLGDAIILDSSDNIGVVGYIDNYYELYSYIVSPSSGTITASEKIQTSDAATMTKGVAAVKLATDSYAIFYTENVSGTYKIYKRTSTDFDTWSSATELSIGGRDSSFRIEEPSVVKLSGGNLMMALSYVTAVNDNEEQVNIVYTISTDDGATWSNITAITDYDSFSEDASYPDITERSDGTVDISYTLDRISLVLNPSESPYWYGEDDAFTCFHVDWTDRYAYLLHKEHGIGWKNMDGISKVDIDTWELVTSWSNTTTPAVPPMLWGRSYSPNRCTGDRHIVAWCVDEGGSYKAACILDTEANQFTPYYFIDCAEYSVTKNISCSDFPDWSGYSTQGVKVDYDNNRVYVSLWSDPYWKVGYFELDDSGPTYTFTLTLQVEANADWGSSAHVWWVYEPENDIAIICHAHGAYGNGHLYMFSISEQAQIKHYNVNLQSSFPWQGLTSVVYSPSDYCLYCAPREDYGSYPTQVGLLKIALATDVMQYIKPEFDPTGNSLATFGEYNIQYMRSWKSSTELLVPSYYGLDIFNIQTQAWEHFSEKDMPGLIPQGGYNRQVFYMAEWDSTKGMYMGSHCNGVYQEGGLFIAWFPDRLMSQPWYTTGTYTTSWDFSTPTQLVKGYADQELRSVELQDDNLFSTWTIDIGAEDHLKWDKEGAQLDLADFLITETPIKWKRSVAGELHSVEFEISHGHLFDTTNEDSLLNIYAKRGRKIELRCGETVSSVDYWAKQGSFYVVETSMSYSRGKYPTMRVVARDRREFWHQHLVEVSSWEDTAPHSAIQGIITNELGYDSADFNLSAFGSMSFTDEEGFTRTIAAFNIDEQWLDTYLDEIVDQIANRFGMYLTVDVDDKIAAREITNNNSVDHAYTNNNAVIEFTPDDTYSDFTNRVIVTGEERDFTEMIYGEERVSSLNGTVGWWGFQKDFTIWYSEDRSRRVKFPRLVVIESATSIMFKLAGKIREKISAEDEVDYLYCVVEVKAPNLIPHLVAAIAMYVAGNIIGDGVPPFSGMTIPIGRILEGFGLVAAMMILGSVGNFQYEIWGRPIGYVRRGLSAQADDEVLQAEIGSIITNKIEGFACDTYSRCEDVAKFELMLARMQRKRVRIKKIAHLQDQEGDTLSFKHPFTGKTITIFVTDLTRTFKKSNPGENDGYVLDEVEGWVL